MLGSIPVSRSTLFLLLLSLSFILAVSDLLLLALLHVELNWESNELRVFLDQVLQASLFKKLGLVLLQIANDLGATLDLSMDQLCVLSGNSYIYCLHMKNQTTIWIQLRYDLETF